MADRIDVLICAHNEVERIGNALDSLERQTIGLEHFRVIVVDNASNDGTAELVNTYADRLDLGCVVEPQLGVSYAYNKGYGIARADYVAHLDADAKAHPQWLENIQKVLVNIHPDLCGGPYYPYYVDPKPPWFLDGYNMNYQGDRPRFLDQNEYLSGTNMVWRRSLVDRLGGFRNEFGLVGRGLARGDETELILRARGQFPEFRAYYDPGIIVFHLTRRKTLSLMYWLRRTFVQAASHEAELANRPGKRLDDDHWLFHAVLDSVELLTLAPARATFRRDQLKYPYWQNYVFEKVLPAVSIIATAYGRWRPRLR